MNLIDWIKASQFSQFGVGSSPLNISATWGCCVLYTVKKINWWRYCLALWRNFRPFPSVWRNLTSHRIELCNTVQSSVKYSEIRQNLFNSVFSGGTVEVLQLFHNAYTKFVEKSVTLQNNSFIRKILCFLYWNLKLCYSARINLTSPMVRITQWC